MPVTPGYISGEDKQKLNTQLTSQQLVLAQQQLAAVPVLLAGRR